MVALALAYVAARTTPLFALRSVEVAGASPEVNGLVREALQPVAGTSLVALDPADAEERVRAVPWVRSAQVDRAFPHTLAVRVRPERPLAVVREGRRAWLVAETGRVVATIEPTARWQLPRIRAELADAPRLGATLRDHRARTVLSVLRAVPPRFPVRVLYGEADAGSVTLVLRGGLELRLGSPDRVAAKLRAAAAVLAAVAREDGAPLSYVDVSVPEHAVAGQNSQVRREG